MPAPPILPTIDWKAVFDGGKPYAEWLKDSGSADGSKVIEERLAQMTPPPQVKTFVRGLARPVHVVAIAEAWCGDVTRHVPALQALAQENDKVKVRFIARADHPDVFARYLTNGGEAIPRFVFLSEDFVECGNWGPMPMACRELISRGKAAGDVGAARKKVGAIYQNDLDARDTFRELMGLLDIAVCTTP